jgi:hypothetical protein
MNEALREFLYVVSYYVIAGIVYLGIVIYNNVSFKKKL